MESETRRLNGFEVLGDIVVLGREGVIQYDFDKEVLREGAISVEPRHPPRPPSSRLLTAAGDLRVAELEGKRPWERHFSRAAHMPWTQRPLEPDELHSVTEPARILDRSRDPFRRDGLPRVFKGPIASGNKLLKNPHLRERLRLQFGVLAIEMEASGVADAAWMRGVNSFVVRGTCDYCDEFKNDTWQGYAALIAAAYARALLEQTRSVRGVVPQENEPAEGRAGQTLPHQLRAAPADFVGRSLELEHLRQHASRATRPVVLGIQGMPGVGKTSLALTLAAQLVNDFCDVQIDLDFGGYTQTPLQASDALLRIVRAFMPAVTLPTSEAELAALYRSLLYGKRTILLFDNVSNSAQVEPLLVPGRCVTIVVSRAQLSLPGLVPKRLDTLDPEAARALAKAVCQSLSDERAHELAEACKNLPLAIRVAAARFQSGPDLPFNAFATRLRTTPGLAEIVAATLDSVMLTLDAELRKVWLFLSAFPRDFDVESAAFVAQIDARPRKDQPVGLAFDSARSVYPKISRALSELVHRNLIEWLPVSSRYIFHDAVHAYASHRLSAQERYAAENNHAAYYLLIARAADGLYRQHRLQEGLELFDRERPNIEAGQRWSADHRADEDTFPATICAEYPLFWECAHLRLRSREMLAWLTAGEEAATRLGIGIYVLRHRLTTAATYRRMGEPRSALSIAEAAVETAKGIGNEVLERRGLNIVGLCLRDVGDLDGALRVFTTKLDRTPTDAKEGRMATFQNIGVILRQAERWQESLDYLTRALELAVELGDRHSEATAHGELGMLLRRYDPASAVPHLSAQLTFAREVSDRAAEAVALGALAVACQHTGHANTTLPKTFPFGPVRANRVE